MTDCTILKQRAGDLRRNQTPAERLLWTRLRMRNVCGVRFLRQYVIGDYIVDFYAPSLRLAIELDGGQHYESDGIQYDERRTRWLEAQGLTVLRYSNFDVSRRLHDVLADIERAVLRLQDLHPPAPAARPPSFRRGVIVFPLPQEGGLRGMALLFLGCEARRGIAWIGPPPRK